jgi:hypothetical protein
LFLVTPGEGVEEIFFFVLVLVTLVSVPPWLWDFIVKQSGGVTLSVLLKSEPLKRVWLLSLSKEWSWSALRVELVHGLIPGLS